MSGIGCMMASTGTAPTPPAPLGCAIGFTGTSGPSGSLNVAGASGTTQGAPYDKRFQLGTYGGTSPYTSRGFVRDNDANHLTLHDLGNGEAYVTWADMGINGSDSVVARAYVTDSTGATAFSPQRLLTITRTS